MPNSGDRGHLVFLKDLVLMWVENCSTDCRGNEERFFFVLKLGETGCT